jgi:hypothetical protein
MTNSESYRAPQDCPVCGADLVVARLHCDTCGTELAGSFTRCEFCALDDVDLDLLRVFLRSRGNVKEVGKYLGVSYPTARTRITSLLVKLGMADTADVEEGLTREQVLAEVATGALTPSEAAELIASLG